MACGFAMGFGSSAYGPLTLFALTTAVWSINATRFEVPTYAPQAIIIICRLVDTASNRSKFEYYMNVT